MKKISILGSTGSIGTQAIDVVDNLKNDFKITALSANSNADGLINQAVKINPKYVVIVDENKYDYVKNKLAIYDIHVLKGIEGLLYAASLPENDIVLNAIVGIAGLRPTIEAIRADKIVALANKETLVAGGDIVEKELKNSKASLIPVDSEHSAIFQCLNGEKKEEVRRIIITASGGPFRGKKKDELLNVTPEMAVKHPKWHMGKKISVDSATLMNKGLEVIEAYFLFKIPYDKINVVVHPQSLIHSMVEYVDGSIKAQIGVTDMRNPIQYALTYPERKNSCIEYFNFMNYNNMTFEKPDRDTFECLDLGYKAGKIGGTMTTVLNAANEEAVNLFLQNKIKFLDIPELIKEAMNSHNVEYNASLERIFQVDKEYKKYVDDIIR